MSEGLKINFVYPIFFCHHMCITGSVVSSTLFFTALHAMQTRSIDENSVCLSVRSSVTR